MDPAAGEEKPQKKLPHPSVEELARQPPQITGSRLEWEVHIGRRKPAEAEQMLATFLPPGHLTEGAITVPSDVNLIL